MFTPSFEKSETAEEKKRGRDIYEETVEESVILVEETIDSVSKTVKKRGPKKKRLETYAEVLLTLPEKEAHKNNNLFEFKLFIPVELEEILIDQETIFLAPSFKGPLPQLPWQSNLPTVARILENFSNRQEDQPVAQYSHISELLPDPTRSHPPHSVIKVISNPKTISTLFLF